MSTHLEILAGMAEKQRKIIEGDTYVPIQWIVRAERYGISLNDIGTNIFLGYYNQEVLRTGKSIKNREPDTYRQTHLRFEKDVEGTIDNIVGGQDNWEYEFFGPETTNTFFNSYHDAAHVMGYIYKKFKRMR